MKIIMALASLDIGGAETHVVELSKEIKRRGHDVVMISGGGVYQKEIEDFGIKHYTVPLKSRNYKNIIKAYGMIKKIIKAEKPDLVHSHARIPSFIIGLVHKSMHKSFVYVTTVHGAFDTSFVVRTLTCWGEKTLAVSEDLKNYLIKYYDVPQRDIYISINGIDSGKFNKDISGDNAAKELSLNEGAKHIVYVSRLEDDVCAPAYAVIDKMSKINEAVPGVEFVIVGGGGAYENVKEKAHKVNEALGRRAVILAGQRTDVNELLATADVCVGVSRAILEPMAMEKLCVIAGQEGYIGILSEDNLAEAIDCNFTCRKCAPINGDILADDIIKLFNMTNEEAQRTAAFAKNVVDTRYSITKMADDNMNMYVNAVKDHVPNTVMVGYYGYGNRGDDALLAAILVDMEKASPTFSPIVLSRNPKRTGEYYGVKSINRFNIFAIIRAMKNAKVFIAGGGSLIQDVTSTRSLMYYLYCLRAAKKHGLKVMLYANGIGPVNKHDNRKKAAEVLNTVDVITLRDSDSAEVLKDLNVTNPKITVTGDAAFGLEECDEKGAKEVLAKYGVTGKFFAVSVRNINSDNGEFIKGFAQMTDYIADRYQMTPVFVPMQFTKDKKISMDIIAHMKSKACFIDENIDVAKIMGLVGCSDTVIAVRLHMLVFGAAMGVPVLGINYDPKVKSNILSLGLGECIEPHDIINGSFVDTVDEFMAKRSEIKEAIPVKIAQYRAKAKENAVIAAELLNDN